MSIIVKINDVDRSDFVLVNSLKVTNVLNNKRDSVSFKIRKNSTITPVFQDDIKVYDGSDLIFGGIVVDVSDEAQAVTSKGIMLDVKASDYSYTLDKRLISKTYTSETILAIIIDMLATNATDFDADNVESTFEVNKIVFNQVTIAQAINRLAKLLNYNWYVDVNKSVHFFEKNSRVAPQDITDTSGNYVYKSLKRVASGSQLVNIVKVRGGEYEGDTFTDSITVSGDASKSFKLPYKMANLTVKLNTVSQDVGVDFIDDFTTKDVLHNFQDRSFRFETALSDGDVIEFSGNPKIRVFAIAEDSDSKNAYGLQEKIIRENDIQDNATARRRATAELYAFAEPLIDAKFFTYDKFLEVGMRVTLESTVRDADNELLINKLIYKMVDYQNFGYQVELVSTKRLDLIAILASLLEPDALDIDEVETSEQIFADTAEAQIQELHEIVSPQEDFADMTINENHLLDPFPPANLNWVYGYYFPLSDSDPNRMARYDRDAVYK